MRIATLVPSRLNNSPDRVVLRRHSIGIVITLVCIEQGIWKLGG